MKACSCKGACAVVFIIALLTMPAVGSSSDRQPAVDHPLLAVGNAGAKAMELKITAEKPEGQAAAKEGPLVIHLQAPAEAYVTAVYVSSEGDAVLVFPNKQVPDSLLAAGKQYTLFGPDSAVQLKKSKVTKNAKIVFFASSKPFQLDPLTIREGEAFLAVPHGEVDQQKVLLGKIEEMAKDERFNRQVIDLGSAVRPVIRLDVMGVGDKYKTRKPGTLAGSQGVQDEPENARKQ